MRASVGDARDDVLAEEVLERNVTLLVAVVDDDVTVLHASAHASQSVLCALLCERLLMVEVQGRLWKQEPEVNRNPRTCTCTS